MLNITEWLVAVTRLILCQDILQNIHFILHEIGKVKTDFDSDIDTVSSTVSLSSDTYTCAIGTNRLIESEARSGGASTPDLAGVTYNFSISTVDVPEPSTLAIFALGIVGLVIRRFKK